jgi:hypothetical protein
MRLPGVRWSDIVGREAAEGLVAGNRLKRAVRRLASQQADLAALEAELAERERRARLDRIRRP